MKNARKKGQYGYRDYHKRIQLLKVGFGAAMILIQLFARNFTDNTSAQNILTVMAVLSVLPTANVASPLLASWKYKTPAQDFYKKTSVYEKTGCLLYDLVITSKEQILPVDAVMVHPTGVYAYCTAGKTDLKKAEAYLNDMFEGQKLDRSVRLFKDEKSFFSSLRNLKPADSYEDDGSVEYGAGLLKSLSM